MSEIDGAVGPSPEDLALLLVRLLGSDWPPSEVERIAWSRKRGLPDSGHAVGTSTGKSFHATEAPDRPGSRFGWHTFRGEFVGVHWFLWEGLPRDEVRNRALELKQRLSEQFGSPEDEMVEDPLTRARLHVFVDCPRSDHRHVALRS